MNRIQVRHTHLTCPANERQRGRRHCQVVLYLPTVIFLLTTPRRAIALSLQDAASAPHAESEVIDLATDSDNDDNDEDARFQAEIEQAIAASKAESSRHSSQTSTAPAVKPSDSGPVTVIGGSAFLSERAQLEKERRERQKRLRPEAVLDGGGEISDDDIGAREPPAKRQHLSSSSSARANNSSTRPTPTSSTSNIPTIDRVFWDGEFRQTATQHAEPRKDGRPTFRITEVLGQVSVYSTLKVYLHILIPL